MSRGQSDVATLWRAFRDSRLWGATRAMGLLLAISSTGYWVLGQLHHGGQLEPVLPAPWSWMDCVYMSVITVSTIGYGEVLPLPQGDTLHDFGVVRFYTVILILVAMILVAYAVSSATAFFVDGDLRRLLERRRAMKRIEAFRGHYVVCGCGGTGHVITQELLATGHQVVVIETDPAHLEDYADHPQVVGLIGDATDDHVLAQAGLDRAAGLAAVLPEDKDNLYLVLSARQLNHTVRIVSAASSREVEQKLRRVGADGVVSSAWIGGLRIASELLRPVVVNFLDQMLRGQDQAVRFAQVVVGPRWSGQPLAALRIGERSGLPVLAVREPGSDRFVFNPAGSHLLREGSAIVTMGEAGRVRQLEALVGGVGEWITAPGVESPPGAEAAGQGPPAAV